MVRKRLFSYHTDRGFIIYGLDRPFKVDLKVMVDMFDDLNFFFFSLSLSLSLSFSSFFYFFYPEKMLIHINQTAVAGLAPNSGLLGGSPEETALVDQWVHLAESEVYAFTNFVRGLCLGRFAYSKPVRRSSSLSSSNWNQINSYRHPFFFFFFRYMSV